MIHPAYFIAGLILEAIVVLAAVAFGFNSAFRAYNRQSPPKLREAISAVTAKEDELPAPISPAAEKRRRTIEER